MANYNLFDAASLAMIPTGVKEDKLYSIKPTDGSGDFTFSRGSDIQSTRVNASGLIEKAKENLLLQSNVFNVSPWASASMTLTSGQTGYDGSSDAWLIDSTGGYTFQGLSLSGVYTYSIYAKKGTADGIRLRMDAATDANAYISLTDGSESLPTSGIGYTATSVGGGWWRISVSINDSSLQNVRFYAIDSSGNSTTGTIYIQDAQLNHGLVAQDYIETTTTAVVEGLTADLPRLDYSGGASCPSLLLEPSRTNYIIQSEYISGWLPAGGTSSQNSQDSTSPEGVYNAAVIDANSAVYRTINAASNPHTYSVYAKAKSGSVLQMRIDTPTTKFTNFDLSDGTIQSTGSGHTASIEDAGNGWYRCIISFTDSIVNVVLQTTASGSVYVWGAQLEDNLYPTSYIPTYGTAANRGADDCYKGSISSLIGQTEGTLFVDFIKPPTGASRSKIARLSALLTDGGNSYLNSINLDVESNGNLRGNIIVSGSSVVDIQTAAYDAGSRVKMAFAYKANDVVLYINGTSIGVDTSASIPSCTAMEIATYETANISETNFTKQALLFKTRLTNAELAALTTL